MASRAANTPTNKPCIIKNAAKYCATRIFILFQVAKITIKLVNIEDTVLDIKVKEILSILPKLKNSSFITEGHYLSMIRYYELLREL